MCKLYLHNLPSVDMRRDAAFDALWVRYVNGPLLAVVWYWSRKHVVLHPVYALRRNCNISYSHQWCKQGLIRRGKATVVVDA